MVVTVVMVIIPKNTILNTVILNVEILKTTVPVGRKKIRKAESQVEGKGFVYYSVEHGVVDNHSRVDYFSPSHTAPCCLENILYQKIEAIPPAQ
jgi:hypothetical protein